MSNSGPEKKDEKPSIFYPLLIIIGIIGNIVNFLTNWQALLSTVGIFISTLLIGIGVIGVFVNQRRVNLRDGVLYSVIWTMLIALAGAGYYIVITRPVMVTGLVLDDDVRRNPVAGIDISLYHFTTGTRRAVVTRPDGTFTFSEVSEGDFDIVIDGITLYSGTTPSGLQKLVQGDVNTGRFYIDNIGSVALLITPTVLLSDTPTETATLAPSPTSMSTETPVATSLTEAPTITATVTLEPTATQSPLATSTAPQSAAPATLASNSLTEVTTDCRIHAPRLDPTRIRREPSVESDALAVVGDQALPVEAILTDENGDQWWIMRVPSYNLSGYVSIAAAQVSDDCLQYMNNKPQPVEAPSLTVITPSRFVLLRQAPSPAGEELDLVYRDDKLHVLASCDGLWYLVERPWDIDSPLWIAAQDVQLDQADAEIPEECNAG